MEYPTWNLVGAFLSDHELGGRAQKVELLLVRKVELLPVWGTQGGATADPSGEIGTSNVVPLPIFDGQLGARSTPALSVWGTQGGTTADPSGEIGAPSFVPLPIFDSRLGARGTPALPASGAQDGKTVDNPGENGIIVGKDTEGAGDGLKFNSWDDFKGYIQDVGKDTSLTSTEKVQKIQKAYDGISDKTDINIPISDKYVKGFTTDGNVDYDWPKYLGFDKTTISSISRRNLLPETWDRYGSMSGSNFADIPSGGRYTYGERSIPYVENEKAYHSGKFNNTTYFDKIDAIRSGDLVALNGILRSEGITPVSKSFFEGLTDKYNYFIEKSAKEVGTTVDATYGLKGKVAAWGDLIGGAGQIVTPFNGRILKELGIII